MSNNDRNQELIMEYTREKIKLFKVANKLSGNEKKKVMKKVDDLTNLILQLEELCVDDVDSSASSENPEVSASTEESVSPNDKIVAGIILSGDYVLLANIGAGNNASVWLSYQISTEKYNAIKIQQFEGYRDGRREVMNVKKIQEWYEGHPDREMYCVSVIKSFIYNPGESVDAKFVCSVYDLYAGSLDILLRSGVYKYGLPINIVKRIIKQLLLSLEVIHNELKIIHTDIKPANILFKGAFEYHDQVIALWKKSGFVEQYEILSMDNQDPDEVANLIEKLAFDCVKPINELKYTYDVDEESIEEEDIEDDDFIVSEEGETSEYFTSEDLNGNPRNQSVDDSVVYDNGEIYDMDAITQYDFNNVLNTRAQTTDVLKIVDDKFVTKCRIAIADFGSSYLYEKRTTKEIQDRRYRAPEVILDLNYGYACDIWSVGCVVFELATGFQLFLADNEPINFDLQHLYLLEKMLGPVPLKMKKNSRRRRFLFDKKRNYHIKNVDTFEPYPLVDRLRDQFLFSNKEAEELWGFIKCCLTYSPKERHTANQLLTHPWLKNVSF